MQQQPSHELPAMTRSKSWLYAAAGLSVLAGLLHLSVMPEHFDVGSATASSFLSPHWRNCCIRWSYCAGHPAGPCSSPASLAMP